MTKTTTVQEQQEEKDQKNSGKHALHILLMGVALSLFGLSTLEHQERTQAQTMKVTPRVISLSDKPLEQITRPMNVVKIPPAYVIEPRDKHASTAPVVIFGERDLALEHF